MSNLKIAAVLVLIGALTGIFLAFLTGCSGPPALTVVSLNLAGGFDPSFTTAESRARQAALLSRLGADVAALSEFVDGDETSLPPGGSLFRAGEVALWARAGLVIADPEEVPLDRGVWVAGEFVSDAWPRSAVVARVADLLVASVHLTATARNDAGQMRDPAPVRALEMAEVAAFRPDVIAGDWNAVDVDQEGAPAELSEIRRALAPLGYRAATTGAPDAVWCRVECSGVVTPSLGASDHPGAAMAAVRRGQ